ncbi:DUF3168 domain-containing protein [Paracidovorax citrulli]|uniref:DUF3168 domain-containing protein n=1 Tax=Paracidovorax citrulli TaxID=80869 RepID=UPI0005FB2BAC|nr:DUF3168 domain-containing protein [Paracidovorax citrulli]UMT88376.1 DUF3168 domain-containing protein [Paracidovorax citrulli]WIY32715.1 DUF3168 domain-containing protein [Paracidovorax citrulli]SDJ30962.1 Protein of unknown function [Paracidovorax citrulli]
MSIESELLAVLQARCPNVYPTIGPHGAPLPRIVFKHVGGRTLRYVENTSNLRNVLMHVAVWADDPAVAFALIRQVEDDLCAHPVLQVEPQGEPTAGIADGAEAQSVYGATQIFSIYGSRD